MNTFQIRNGSFYMVIGVWDDGVWSFTSLSLYHWPNYFMLTSISVVYCNDRFIIAIGVTEIVVIDKFRIEHDIVNISFDVWWWSVILDRWCLYLISGVNYDIWLIDTCNDEWTYIVMLNDDIMNFFDEDDITVSLVVDINYISVIHNYTFSCK